MKILITGGAGFIGSTLARALAATEIARNAQDTEFKISRILLADRVQPQAPDDPRVETAVGDVGDPAFIRSLVTPDTRLVFHLAGVVSGAAEADFALGMHANLDGTRHMLEACRALPEPARLVFASSIAVYGRPLPDIIDDDTPMRPTLSYGVQKLVCEILLGEYTRRNFVDARALRLSGVVVRPPAPNGALSGFNSDLIREPIEGREYTCPVGPEATIWMQSVGRCVKNLIHAAHLPSTFLGDRRALLLPAVAVSIGEIVDAIRHIVSVDAAARVRYQRNDELQEQFGAWPRRIAAARATRLGFEADAGLGEIIRGFVKGRSGAGA